MMMMMMMMMMMILYNDEDDDDDDDDDNEEKEEENPHVQSSECSLHNMIFVSKQYIFQSFVGAEQDLVL